MLCSVQEMPEKSCGTLRAYRDQATSTISRIGITTGNWASSALPIKVVSSDDALQAKRLPVVRCREGGRPHKATPPQPISNWIAARIVFRL